MRRSAGGPDRSARLSTGGPQAGYGWGVIELLRTNDPTVIAFATALLRGEDIDCFVFDVHTSILEGSLGVLPRRLMVPRDQAFMARAVLRDNDLGAELTPEREG